MPDSLWSGLNGSVEPNVLISELNVVIAFSALAAALGGIQGSYFSLSYNSKLSRQ